MWMSSFHSASERENKIEDYETIVNSQYWWICRRVALYLYIYLYLGSAFLLCALQLQ